MAPSAISTRGKLELELVALPDLERRPSRFGDSLSYFVGGREIAHFHGDSRMDLRLTRSEIRRLQASHALDHRIKTRGSYAEWAAIQVREDSDIPFILSLVEAAIRANS